MIALFENPLITSFHLIVEERTVNHGVCLLWDGHEHIQHTFCSFMRQTYSDSKTLKVKTTEMTRFVQHITLFNINISDYSYNFFISKSITFVY